MQIRAFRQDELHLLAEFWNRIDDLIPGTLNAGLTLTEAEAREWYVSRNILYAVAAYKDEQMIGFLDITQGSDKRTAILDWIAVLPQYQSTMLVGKLALTAYKYALGRYEYMEAKSWPANHALVFYKKFGKKWIPGTGVKFINYLPIIKDHPLCSDYFQRHDLIKSNQVNREIFEPYQKWKERDVVKYDFSDAGEDMRVFIDVMSKQVAGVEVGGGHAALAAICRQAQPLGAQTLQVTVELFCPAQAQRVIVCVQNARHTFSVAPGGANPSLDFEIPLEHIDADQLIVEAIVVERERVYSLFTSVALPEQKKHVKRWAHNGFTILESDRDITVKNHDLHLMIGKRGGTLQVSRSDEKIAFSQGAVEIGPPYQPSIISDHTFQIKSMEANGRDLVLSLETSAAVTKDCGRLHWELALTPEAQFTQKFYTEFPTARQLRISPVLSNEYGTLYYPFDEEIISGELLVGEFPLGNDLYSEGMRYTGRWCAVTFDDRALYFSWSHANKVVFHQNRIPQLTACLSTPFHFECDLQPFDDIRERLNVKHKINYTKQSVRPYIQLIATAQRRSKTMVEVDVRLQTICRATKDGWVQIKPWGADKKLPNGFFAFEGLSAERPVETTLAVDVEQFNGAIDVLQVAYEFNGIIRTMSVPIESAGTALREDAAELQFTADDHHGALQTVQWRDRTIVRANESEKFGVYYPWPGGLFVDICSPFEPAFNLLTGDKFQPVAQDWNICKYRVDPLHIPELEVLISYELDRAQNLLLANVQAIHHGTQALRPLRFRINTMLEQILAARLRLDNTGRELRIGKRATYVKCFAQEADVALADVQLCFQGVSSHADSKRLVFFETFGKDVYNVGLSTDAALEAGQRLEMQLSLQFIENALAENGAHRPSAYLRGETRGAACFLS